MTDTKEISWDDSVLPFHLEGPDMRGRIARLGQTLEHILSRHDYPVAVSALVAELSTLTALIGRIGREHGRTLLVVEHHLDVVLALVDRVAVLHHGTLLACDTPAAVMADDTVQQAYLGRRRSAA